MHRQFLCFGSLFVVQLLLSSSVVALSVGQSLFSQQGVASLLGASKKIFAGTKRGDLLILEQPSGSSFEITNREQVDSKTFPVYSLTASKEFLFCGCGDRYVSLLFLNSCEQGGNVQEQQRLGPHTRWVKDLCYDSKSELLFSIGCNCIETWSRTPKGSWEHANKRTIESSPTEGSTLSSDLLCLCNGVEDSDYFYSGGVDGRIHVWSVDPSVKEPLLSIGAHTGRLNCLLYDSNFLFSAGNDGKLQCRRASGRQLNKEPIVTIDIGEELRVTAGSLLKSSESTIDMVLGCSNGALKHFCVVFDKSNMSISEQDQITIAGGSSIQALLLVPSQDGALSVPVLVGHSTGLDVVNL